MVGWLARRNSHESADALSEQATFAIDPISIIRCVEHDLVKERRTGQQ